MSGVRVPPPLPEFPKLNRIKHLAKGREPWPRLAVARVPGYEFCHPVLRRSAFERVKWLSEPGSSGNPPPFRRPVCAYILEPSHAQLRKVAKQLQRLGIGQGLLVLDRTAMHHLAHGKFRDLARLGAGNVGNRDDFRRNVARAGAGADFRADALFEIVIQATPAASLTNRTTRTSSSKSWPMQSASAISGICST